MQKRSRGLEIRFHPVDLPPDFPIFMDPDFVQRDHDIRYLHVHPCLELGLCHEGSGVFMVDRKVLPFSAGDVTFINHSEVHLARSSPGTTSRWTWIYLDPLRMLDLHSADREYLDTATLAGPGFSNIVDASEDPAIPRLVGEIANELRARPSGHRAAVRGMVLELMVRFHRARPRATGVRTSGAAYERIAPALQEISRRYASPVQIGPLARTCGMSTPTLRRLFQTTLQQSPREYWHNMRLLMAASLLRTTDRSILEISQDVGFETLSSFNRLFRSHFGIPPRQWRTARGREPASR